MMILRFIIHWPIRHVQLIVLLVLMGACSKSPINGNEQKDDIPTVGSLLWTYDVGVPIGSSAAIFEDSTLFWGTVDSCLYSISTDGVLKWRINFGTELYADPTISPDGIIYIGGMDGRILAISIEGTLLWTYQTEGWIQAKAALSVEGDVYVSCSGAHRLYALDQQGLLKWYLDISIPWSPTVADDGTIYVTSMRPISAEIPQSSLLAIDSTGNLLWTYSTEHNSAHKKPAFGADGTIYFTAMSYGSGTRGTLYALNLDGTLQWKYDTGDQIRSAPVVDSTGYIYFGTWEGRIFSLYPNGDLKWDYTISRGPQSDQWNHINSAPAISNDGIVYFGSGDGYIRAVDSVGQLLWWYPTGVKVEASPTIGSSGNIYIGSLSGIFYAFEDTLTGLDTRH